MKFNLKINTLFQLFFFLLLILPVLSVCSLLEGPKETIKVTVSITRLGNPWMPEYSRYFDTLNAQAVDTAASFPRLSPPKPPYDRPRLYAYINPDKQLGSSDAFYPKNQTDFEQGKYQFEIDIIAKYLPCYIYFGIEVPMAGFYPKEITNVKWVEKNSSIIDLGIINFDVIRLSGNLPVTFNGNTSTANTYSRTERRPIIFITKNDESYIGGPAIGPDGEWVQYYYSHDTPEPVNFNLQAREKGGVFSINLNNGNTIFIHNTDKEIIFKDYTSIDFQCFTFSGTVDLPNFQDRRYLNIEFFDNNDIIGVVDLYSYQFEKNDAGYFKWETMIPFFVFPKNIFFKINYVIDSTIFITNDIDLTDIHLGSFLFPN